VESQVGPYRIVERLGAGGMGEVYLADDTRLGRQVALKRLSDPSLGDAAARLRILREAGAAATLNHPNVAAVYDVLDAEGRAYIVMEYVPGESLADQVHQQGPLPVDRVVQVGLQLCDALAEAHGHNIIHRDLKPANVRVTPEGRVKVLDFGLAKRHSNVAAVAATESGQQAASLALAEGQVIGTPAYMAPEVLLGQPADQRSDIYSLGVTLFELAMGRQPFEGSNFLSIALAVLTEPPPPITTMLPGGLGEIVAKCMARDQSKRYQSATALRRDLASLSAEMSTRPTALVHVPSSIRERLLHGAGEGTTPRTLWRVGAAAAALVVAIVALLWFGGSGASPARPAGPPVVAVLAMPTVSDTAAFENLGLGVAAELGGYLSNNTQRATIVNSSGTPILVQKASLFDTGRDLGATFLVPVVVQVQAGRVQLNAQLVRVENQAVLGSATERGTLGDTEFFDLQQKLAARVVTLLESQVGATPGNLSQRTAASSVNDFVDFSAAIALLGRRFVAGNVDKAVSLLEGVVSRSPGFAAAYAGLASAYLTQFRETKQPSLVDKAIASARQAVDLDASDPRGLSVLAMAYQAAGRTDEAEQVLKTGLQRQPRSDDLHRMLGDVLVRRGQVDAGLAELREAIRLRPDYWENPATLGLALYSRGRYEEALDPFRRAVELAPSDPLAQQRLASTYHQMGRLDEALDHYRHAIRSGGTPSTFSNIGTILYRQGKFNEALGSYNESLKLRPNSPQTWRSKGDTLNRLGRPEEAREAWEKAASLAENMLQANTSDALARGFLAVCRAKLGEVEPARALAAQAMREAPGNPEVIYRNAVVNTLTGNLDQGRALLAQALKAGYSASEAAIDDDLRALGPLSPRAAM
jgi:tetratricopeptide (TPR) repeat protein/tRNA A-37 threonylcarbamoyl transferase component Bud32/TolB-like protein